MLAAGGKPSLTTSHGKKKKFKVINDTKLNLNSKYYLVILNPEKTVFLTYSILI